MKKLLLVAVLAVLGELVGCSDAVFPYLTTIAVTPAAPSVAAGRTQQFTATGTFSNGATKDITSLVKWSSSATTVGTINSAGLAQSYSQGASTITATFTGPAAGTVTSTTTLTVGAPALVSVIVTDATAVIPSINPLKTTTIARLTGHQYVAYGIYSDGGERILNTPTWASTPATVATISTTGRATSIAAGTATITATDPGSGIVSSGSSLVVTAATISSIVVYPAVATNPGLSIAPNTRLPFSALGVFVNGTTTTTQDITADATWGTANAAVATVTTATPKGVVTAVAFGATQIQATFSGTIGIAPLAVSTASLTSITLTPAPAAGASGVGVAVGSILPITAVGTFSDGTKQTINLAVAWTVSAGGTFATVDPTGVVTGVAVGAATVRAQLGAMTTNLAINVEAVKSIAVGSVIPIVNPSILNIALGTASQYAAIATLTDGTLQDVSASATWTAISPPQVSGTPPVATVSDVLGSSGWVTGNAAGTAVITAVFSGQANPSSVTVTAATLKTLAIAPSAPTHLALGAAQQYTATGTFSDSSTQNLSNQVTWGSSAPTVAVMNLTGLAISSGTGTTNVTATSNITTPATTSPAVVLSTP